MEKFTSIRVCAYNVLAQNLATSKYFPSAKQALKIAKRYPLLRHKFQAINADIICVSEAFNDVVDILRSLEYEVRYIQRHNKTYGNAIAWRSQLFEVEREATASLNDCANAIQSFPIRIEGSGVSIVREDFITENIAMFMQFRLKQHVDSHICVCSSHLYWDPSKDPVKVAQAQMFATFVLIACLIKFLLQSTTLTFVCYRLHLCSADFAALCGGCPIIIGADLNSLPDSEVYHRLLDSGTSVVGRPEVSDLFQRLV
jgi:mRNA deadenylase 3'-5' endonuclease subunit Ccr4